MDPDERFRKAQRAAEKTAREAKAGLVFQIGSSLRKEDFSPRSDVNLIAVSEEEPGRMFRVRKLGGIEVRIVRESKKEFVERLEKGSPMELLAWNYGEVLKGEDFRKDVEAEITPHTLEIMVHNSLNSYQEVLEAEYKTPKFRNEAYYSYRDLSRGLIGIEEGNIVSGDKEIKNALERIDKDISDVFWRIRNQRLVRNPESGNIEGFVKEIEDLAKYVCRKKGLEFLSRKEAEERLSERKYEIHKFLLDFKDRKVLLSGDRDGAIGMFIWDMEQGDLRRHLNV